MTSGGTKSTEMVEDMRNIWRLRILTSRRNFVAALCGFCMATTSLADELMIYPSGNQTPEQQEQDQFTCYRWAKDQSGFDPIAPPTVTEPPPQQQAKKGGVGRGLIRGAAIGVIVGDSSSSAKKGAAAGAAIGGMRRRDQKRKEEAARQQWEQEQQHIYAENRNRYNRAYAACLEGKDYTVR
jgi:hypothetical protein